MSGLFHIVFGTMVGLVAWKVAGKRWSAGIVLIFIINSYFGPDLRGAIKPLSAALKAPVISHLAVFLHTYLGWTMFSFIWAPLFYGCIRLIDRSREQKGLAVIHHPYRDVLLATIAGGLLHLFVDTFGNLAEGMPDILKTSMDLFVLEADLWVIVGILAALVVGLTILFTILFRQKGILVKARLAAMMPSIKAFFTDKRNLIVIVAVLIVLGNTLLIVGLQTLGGFSSLEYREDRKTGYYAMLVVYDAGKLLGSMKEFSPVVDVGTTYTAIIIAAGIICYAIVYAKGVTVRIRRITIKGEIMVLLIFLAAAVIGYMLQPIIGNISENEGDVGGLIYGWCCVLTPVVLLFGIKGGNTPGIPGTV